MLSQQSGKWIGGSGLGLQWLKLRIGLSQCLGPASLKGPLLFPKLPLSEHATPPERRGPGEGKAGPGPVQTSL